MKKNTGQGLAAGALLRGHMRGRTREMIRMCIRTCIRTCGYFLLLVLYKMTRPCVVAFMGAGWRHAFLLGVAKRFQDVGMHKHDNTYFAGVSCGSGVAHSLAHGIVEKVCDQVKQNRKALVGMCDLVSKVLEACNDRPSQHGKLTVGLYRFDIGSNGIFRPVFNDQFDTFEEEKHAIRASCQIPFIGGSLLYRIPGDALYIDGELGIDSKMIRRHFVEKCDKPRICIVDVDRDNADADIVPSTVFPRHWTFFPPNNDKFDMMFDDGYAQADKWLLTSSS